MRPVTAAFRAAVRAPHKLATLVEVLGSPVVELVTVRDGGVTLDARAASRGRMDITIVDDGTLGLVPTASGSMLAPYGRELRISRGVVFADGTRELAALGVFRIDSTIVEDSAGDLVVRVAGLDRSGQVIDARFEEPYEIAAGTNVESAIFATVQACMPSVVMVSAGSTFTTPLVRAAEGDDRWKFCQDIAAACGLTLFFDELGQLAIRPAGGSATIAAQFVEGEGGVLLKVTRRWSRTGAFNRVIATGENTGATAPARGVATDDNPLSPTYYHGPFGRVPRFFQSQFIATDAQALEAATAMLAREKGTTQEIDFGVVVDPSLEPGDRVRITRARAGVDEDHTIDSLTIPLSPDGEMTGATRGLPVT